MCLNKFKTIKFSLINLATDFCWHPSNLVGETSPIVNNEIFIETENHFKFLIKDSLRNFYQHLDAKYFDLLCWFWSIKCFGIEIIPIPHQPKRWYWYWTYIHQALVALPNLTCKQILRWTIFLRHWRLTLHRDEYSSPPDPTQQNQPINNLQSPQRYTMFVEKYIHCFVYLFGHVACQCCYLASSDILFAQLSCPLNDVIFCFHQTNLPSTNIRGIHIERPWMEWNTKLTMLCNECTRFSSSYRHIICDSFKNTTFCLLLMLNPC